MDQELKAYLEDRFAQLEKTTRKDLRVIAGGVMSVSERLEAFQVDTTRNLEDIREWVAPDDEIPVSQSKDLRDELRDLDRRIKHLEARTKQHDKDAMESLISKFEPLAPQTP